MANGNGFVITKETWENMPAEQREWLLFDTLQDMNRRLKLVAETKKIQLTIGGGSAGAGKVADITVLWRPLVAGGYYLNA